MANFFDKVVAGIDKGVSSVSEGSKSFVEKARINNQIQDIQKNKMNMMRNLGELVYNLHVSGAISIEQCEGMCNEITSYNEKISELQKTIEEIEMRKNAPAYIAPEVGGVECPICATTNPADSKFCAVCGAKIPEMPVAPEIDAVHESAPDTSGVICSGCGTVNEPGSRFCAACGSEIVAVAEVPEEEIAPPSIYTSEPKPKTAALICPNCETINEPGVKFCAGCGSEISEEIASDDLFYTSKDSTPEGTVCPNCLTNNEPDARFCATCGTPLL